MDVGQGELVTSSNVVGSPNAAKLAHELQKDFETPMTRGDQMRLARWFYSTRCI